MVGALRTMMEEAVHEGMIPANPVTRLGEFHRSAKRIKERIDPFTMEEPHHLEAKCREKFPEYHGLILCLARTGMRIGEAFGLQWRDMDFNRGHILVRRNIPPHRHVETPKTAASEGKADLGPELAAELKRQMIERKKQALAGGKTFDMEHWMFPNDEGNTGLSVSPSSWANVWLGYSISSTEDSSPSLAYPVEKSAAAELGRPTGNTSRFQ
jgi:integrase